MTKQALRKQFGGTAIFSIYKAAHREDSKKGDSLNLGRWTCVRFRGKNNHIMCIISAYRPNLPSGGPYTVYAQQQQGLNQINNSRFPRLIFIEYLVKIIKTYQTAGDHIILMIFGNTYMHNSIYYTN
jgi:hypothetical protein